MPDIKKQVRTFANTNAAQRYLYHTQIWSIGGTTITPGVMVGTMVVSIAPIVGGAVGRFYPIFHKPVWGPVATLYEMKIPTFAAFQQMLAIASVTGIQISIDVWVKPSIARLGPTVAETTSISGMV